MIKDNNGNMPFAVIAVMILLLASVAGAVMVDHSRSERAIDNTVSGTKAIDESLDDIGSYINQELGVIILDISKDDSLGSLDDRAEVFEERADLWIDYRFPINSGGVTTELIDYDVDLEAESMELFTDESAIGGYIPSYLHGTGVITVRAHSDHGSTVRTISISTDGSYALPLASEQGSIFEMMVRDGGISISQMMTYELQSLAQYRVMNGYGSQTQFGSKGTDSIITRSDVQDAYERSLDVIKAICFRDPQTDLLYSDVDLADLIVGESIDIDIDSFRGQMLMSVVDDIILKWYDYLCIGDVWDRLHPNKGISKAFQNALIRFLNGDDAFSAEGYIVGKMAYYGVDEILYRTPGSGTTTLTMDDVVITVENPTIDIMDQNWIKWFSLNYDSKKDAFKDSMRSALIEASKRIASNGSGIISIQIDPYDDISFIDQITDAYLSSLDGSFENEIIESMSSSTFYDPFYASIANTVMQHASSLLDTEELVNRLVIALEEAGIALENDVNSCPEIVKAIHEYESKVYSDLSVYELLTTIEGSGPGLFNDILTSIAQYDIEELNLKHLMTERASILIEEMVANMRIEAYSGLTEMPSGNSFILVDGSENRTAERLFLELYTGPIIDEPRVLKSKCTHMTGLFEDFCAGYSTTFQVSLRDLIEYRVSGMSTFSSSMDSSITAASKGMIVNDLCIEISVALRIVERR
mgnify:CR=1 FL=1